jgi:hypothetical protein
MSATRRDHEPTAAGIRLMTPAVLAVMAMLPQLGCAHQHGVARRDGLGRTLRTVDPGLVPGDAASRPPDRSVPAVPMIGADRGPGRASGPAGVRLDASREAAASLDARLLAACWETKIPPPRLRLAPPASRLGDGDVDAGRRSGGLFASREDAGIRPPAASRAIGPASADELLAACAITRIPPPITLGLRCRCSADPPLAVGRTDGDAPIRPTAPPPMPRVLAGSRSRREYATWD